MKKTMMMGALLVLLALAATASAQFAKLKNTTPGERAAIQNELMKSKLGLSPDQEKKIAELNLKYANKMQPIIQGSEGPFEEMRDVRSINEEKEGELKRILSPDQFQKYLAGKEEMREKFEQRIMSK